jgi:hypothetical protein
LTAPLRIAVIGGGLAAAVSLLRAALDPMLTSVESSADSPFTG